MRLLQISIFLSAVLLIASDASLSEELCRDALPICPTYKALCGNPIIRINCNYTCDSCIKDPCTSDNGGCEHHCTSNNGLKACSCLRGFQLARNNRSCEDINECAVGANPCPSSQPVYCVNNVGSYSCERYACHDDGHMNYYRSNECCALRNSSCGVTASIHERLLGESEPILSSRIFGGRASASSAWPWQAQIVRGGVHQCGASLISDQWLIGAAHCFTKYSFHEMLVYLGIVTGGHVKGAVRSIQEQRVIVEVITAPNYDFYNNDIALIRLSRPVLFNDFIQPICLPCGEVPSLGDRCWVTGFGRTETSGEDSSDVLHEVDVPIVSNAVCSESYDGIYDIIEEEMFCAGYKEGVKDACVGDSGGPLSCQRNDSCEWYLSGVTSFGNGCGEPGYYGVYANVVNYESWIRETVGDNATGLCSKTYNPCRGRINIDDDCYLKLDDCEAFPYYMETNCNYACCQLRHNDYYTPVEHWQACKNGSTIDKEFNEEKYYKLLEVTNCYDEADICGVYARQCTNPIFRRYLEKNCKKTCGVC